LRVSNTEGSTVGGLYSHLPDNSWREDSVTWNSAPPGDRAVLDKLDDVAPGNWYEVDVTPAVTGDGTVSFRAESSSSDGAAFSSTEGTSGLAPQLLVTLAAPGAPVSAVGVFSDGFETGDMSRWEDYQGVTVRSGGPYSGAWAARATSAGEPAFAFTNLPVSQKELYTRVRFKLHANASTTTTLLRLLTAGGAGLAKLNVTNSGRLVTSNSVSDVARTTATPVTIGAWHTAQIRLLADGTASRLELWLDGQKFDAVSIGDSLGTTPIGRIQIGNETAGKTHDFSLETSSPTPPRSRARQRPPHQPD